MAGTKLAIHPNAHKHADVDVVVDMIVGRDGDEAAGNNSIRSQTPDIVLSNLSLEP